MGLMILAFVLAAGLILGPTIILAIDAKQMGIKKALREFSPFGLKYCSTAYWSDTVKDMYIKRLIERFSREDE